MPLIADTSIAAAWAFPDESTAIARKALENAEAEGIVVPPLFLYEIQNALLMGERRHRIEPSDTDLFWIKLHRMIVRVAEVGTISQTLRLARKHQLTAYDAAYLELAVREGLPLATLDRHLARAARAEGLTVLTDAAQ